jgi:hypothetical protein
MTGYKNLLVMAVLMLGAQVRCDFVILHLNMGFDFLDEEVEAVVFPLVGYLKVLETYALMS